MAGFVASELLQTLEAMFDEVPPLPLSEDKDVEVSRGREIPVASGR